MRDEPCSHPGCKSHVSHPCEGCGRMWSPNRETPLEVIPFDMDNLVMPVRYRVWDLEAKEMYTWEKLTDDGNINYEMHDWIEDAIKSHMSGPSSDEWAEQTILMQYVGFEDVTDKPVYTGDIVKYYCDKLNDGRQWVVGRQGSCFTFINAGVWQLYSCWPVDEHKTEIVGNVFENPEEIGKCGYIKWAGSNEI